LVVGPPAAKALLPPVAALNTWAAISWPSELPISTVDSVHVPERSCRVKVALLRLAEKPAGLET